MKNLKLMSMLFGGLMVLGSLTACGGSDNDEPEPTPEPPKPTKVVTSLKVVYTATVSQQLIDLSNVVVRYIGENGQVASEQMSSPTWTKTVTMPLPAKAGMNIQPTLKGSVADGEYTISAKGQMAYSWLDQDGQQLQEGLTEYTPALEAVFYADGLGQYLGAITANCQLARAFAKDYSVSDATITWGGNAGDDSTQATGISNEGATEDNR
ncbi:MAG: hypothetical protein II404_11395 [Prevotella sp.]|nr:hypothetical protein [Prevotella sp.]